ncbi:MAG: DUF445 family protein [Actinophytocola sp.]|uniref:DUF445 domain-containing protein n=1 Tax=Actinophytocola sp. TaxID=1872138 RepID=UPI0013255964|nr:DUF445 family protein [Actinophytocola sp.]MPZ83473.1 DUF445 family protein [Actinophytocola sp.]
MVDDFVAHWQVYLTMPVIAAVIGYLTKRAAIEMMFRPLRFVGLKAPWLGWQGVVPRNSERMIRVSADLLTKRLVDTKEIFARLDADRLAKEIEGPLLIAVDEVTREVMEQYQPGLWEMLPPLAQEMLVKQVQAGSPVLVKRIMAEIQESIDEVLDIRQVAVDALHRDKALLISLVRDISKPEMAFIARCGVYFGLTLGLVQTVVWAVTKNPLVLPLFGAAIGWFTDWLAIKLVFFPRRPKRIGGLAIQGVFQRRRDEVAKQYAEIVAREVMTVPNILDAILRGPRSDRLLAMIHHAVLRTIDEQAGAAEPVIAVTVGSERYQQMKHTAADRAMRYLPDTITHATDYATDVLDIRDTIATRMRRLTRIEYEGLLRPAFRQDEWKLIAVGAVIGAVIGELQVLLLLH